MYNNLNNKSGLETKKGVYLETKLKAFLRYFV